jgi:predicted nucleic acid-binding protein
MTRSIVDSNIILRYLLRDDERKFAECVRLFRAARENRVTLILPPIVAYEVVWVLERTYKYDRGRICAVMNGILNTPEIKCAEPDNLRLALEIYGSKNVKFGDAVIAAWGREKGVDTIYTYDEKDFKKIGGLEVKKP